jgi:predicted Zn-ribbon and HTH transcriptional regulator
MNKISNLNSVMESNRLQTKTEIDLNKKKCPKCGNEDIQDFGNYCYCPRCDYEW